jgi:kynureninase
VPALTAAEAERLDADDPLRPFRRRFRLPPDGPYLDGNSLGALPLATMARLTATVEDEWGTGLVTSWNAAGWFEAPARVGAKIARLIGAAAEEVIVADSTTLNLWKLLGAACLARPGRGTILSEPGNFPTDLYAAEGVARAFGRRLRLADIAEITAAIDEDTAVLLLTHVHYKSADCRDMAALTAAAHARGALVLWDLSHSAGAVPVDLRGAGADLAVGCGYKYLNGGPGAPAFLFASAALQPSLVNPLSGWMGHAAPFAFEDGFRGAEGMRRFLAGTPPVIGLAALEAGVDLLLEAPEAQRVAKSRALGQAWIGGVEALDAGFTLASPRDPALRGSHVSFAHPQAFAIVQALIARSIVGDFRAPDLMRMGFAPIYNSFADIARAIEALRLVMAGEEWRRPAFSERGTVT